MSQSQNLGPEQRVPKTARQQIEHALSGLTPGIFNPLAEISARQSAFISALRESPYFRVEELDPNQFNGVLPVVRFSVHDRMSKSELSCYVQFASQSLLIRVCDYHDIAIFSDKTLSLAELYFDVRPLEELLADILEMYVKYAYPTALGRSFEKVCPKRLMDTMGRPRPTHAFSPLMEV